MNHASINLININRMQANAKRIFVLGSITVGDIYFILLSQLCDPRISLDAEKWLSLGEKD